MFNKKILAVSMAVAMTGGITTQSHAIEVTNNDVGQVLLGPVFYAESGYTTDITVTNTRTDAAVKAKVVFRSNKHSVEILDFVIYLTPGDVWRGQVIQNSGDGLGHLISSDDSIRASGEWGNVVTNDIPFFAHALDSDDSTTFGHFEVIGSYAAEGAYTLDTADTTDDVTIAQKMSKTDLKAVFDWADNPATVNQRELDYTNCLPTQITANDVSSISPCSLQLMGEVRIGSTTEPNRGSYRMTALGTATAAAANTELAAEQANYVITNTAFNATTGKESLIGFAFGVTGNTWASDNILGIETALAADSTSYEYEASSTETTHTTVSFPTKYRHRATDICTTGATLVDADNNSLYTAPFQHSTTGVMNYSYSSFDNSENSITSSGSEISGGPDAVISNFPNEINYHYTMGNFSDSGWAYYGWRPLTGCPYVGAPVIAMSYKFRPSTTSTEVMMQRAPNR